MVADYEGGRTELDIVQFVEGYILPPIVKLNSSMEVAKFRVAKPVVVLGHFHELNKARIVSTGDLVH